MAGKLLQRIEENVIGRNAPFQTPFGTRQVVYCDYTASGRALRFIEEYILNEVLPFYANTHTTTGVTAEHTTALVRDAREIIRKAVNASEDDAVIFTGSGSTSAVQKLVRALEIKFTDGPKPVVFVGPFEHHSNLLPFRESGWQVVRIREADDGCLDLHDLEEQLSIFGSSNRPMVGTFSAASNVTGILTDTVTVSSILHRHGALALWDYATAAPYTNINMHPTGYEVNEALAYKDAVFISPHKFVGGVNSPGLLVARSSLFSWGKPTGSGGGSVAYVTRTTQSYLKDVENREEAGTCNIVGIIRAGLAFQLKEMVGSDAIMAKEHTYVRRALEVLTAQHSVQILGMSEADRLPVFSFLVQHQQTNRYIHYNFISSLLNDLFGIQTRGGCMCAGPYALDLLGINEEKAMEILDMEEEPNRCSSKEDVRRKLFRPGFTRFSLPYFMTEEDVEYALSSLVFVAEHGWKFLPYYTFDLHSGEWHHTDSVLFNRSLRGALYTLSEFSLKEAYMNSAKEEVCGELLSREETLAQAREILQTIEKSPPVVEEEDLLVGDEQDMLWFLMPSEASRWLHTLCKQRASLPFCPRQRKARNTVTSLHLCTSSTTKGLQRGGACLFAQSSLRQLNDENGSFYSKLLPTNLKLDNHSSATDHKQHQHQAPSQHIRASSVASSGIGSLDTCTLLSPSQPLFPEISDSLSDLHSVWHKQLQGSTGQLSKDSGQCPAMNSTVQTDPKLHSELTKQSLSRNDLWRLITHDENQLSHDRGTPVKKGKWLKRLPRQLRGILKK